MTEVCPHCGSTAIRVFPNRAGTCARCGEAFSRPLIVMQSQLPQTDSRPYKPHGKSPRTDSPEPLSGGVQAAVEGESPTWRRTFQTPATSVATQPPGAFPAFGQSATIWEKIKADEARSAQECRKIGKYIIYTGSLLLLISQILTFFFLVPIQALFAALTSSLIGVVICGGLLANSILSLIGFGAGEHVAQGSPQTATLCIVIGGFAIALSLIVTGGILGALGGVLLAVGGALGLA